MLALLSIWRKGKEKRLPRIWGVIAGVAAISLAASAFAGETSVQVGTPMVVAQAGSTGGAIGKQGKEASGSNGTEEGTHRKPLLHSLAPTTSMTAQYLGCFRDQGDWLTASTKGRDLNGLMANDPGMTTERCVGICRSQGFAYAGTQYSTYCFCGNAYGRTGTADNCDMTCGGNQAQKCGGAWANSVYRASKIK
jgi:hypothetical protein